VRGLVELANEVIAFKRERTGRSEGDETEQSEVAGAAPILVAGDEDALADAIRGFGPRCAVVAGSAAVRERLQTALGTTRVFTVPEAKGPRVRRRHPVGRRGGRPRALAPAPRSGAEPARGSARAARAPSSLRGGDARPPSSRGVRAGRRAAALDE
jgi:hypothetical protein